MKRLIVSAFAALLFSVAGLAAAPHASAVDLFGKCDSVEKTQCQIVKEDNLNYQGKNSIWKMIQFALGILGGIAVLMIVIGGIKFATSAGDPAGVSSAKRTIIYAVIGLVVAIMASAIVLLVNNYFGGLAPK